MTRLQEDFEKDDIIRRRLAPWIVLANRLSLRTRRRGSKSIAQNDEEKKYIREYASTSIYLSRFILAKKRAFLVIGNASTEKIYAIRFFLHLLQAAKQLYSSLLIASSGIFLNATEYDEREATDIRPLFRSR